MEKGMETEKDMDKNMETDTDIETDMDMAMEYKYFCRIAPYRLTVTHHSSSSNSAMNLSLSWNYLLTFQIIHIIYD